MGLGWRWGWDGARGGNGARGGDGAGMGRGVQSACARRAGGQGQQHRHVKGGLGQGHNPACPEGPFPRICCPQSGLIQTDRTGDGDVPVTPLGLPILLQLLLENKARKIPVDLQATNWKLYLINKWEELFSLVLLHWMEVEIKYQFPNDHFIDNFCLFLPLLFDLLLDNSPTPGTSYFLR